MSYLSPEVVDEILWTLPVKSLCRFKCVSKEWLNLISSTRFVKMHLSRTETLGRTRLHLLADGMWDLFSLDLETVSYNDDKITMLGLNFPEECASITCIGSCNGLLCLTTGFNTDLFVYNPSTQECKQILRFGGSTSIAYLYGFGYVESIDDYKVVRIACRGEIVEVYSLGKKSWSTIKKGFLFPKKYYKAGFLIKVGLYLNGAIHWAFENRKGSCVIAAFDLVEEKFKTLPPPENVLKRKCKYTLGVLRGILYLTVDKSDGLKQFCVMTEYGVKRSWKIMWMGMMHNPLSELRPLSILTNNITVLLMAKEGLIFVDEKDKKSKNVEVGVMYQVDGIEQYNVVEFETEVRGFGSDLYVYTESLVSPRYKSDFTTQGTMSNLPRELIIDILLRLPVKFVCRFKCISKKWQFLISHPLFVKWHLSRTQTLGRRIRLLGDSRTDLFSVELETVSGNDDKISLLGLEFPGRQLDDTRCLRCIDSCNGLLGIVNEDGDLFVYNPSTKKCNQILNIDGHPFDSFFGYGFGYAESIDDYKLVTIYTLGNVYVYSVLKRSWRSIIPNRFLFPEYYYKMGIYFNGAIHWAFDNLEGSCVIVTFDLVEEKFETLPPPDTVLIENCTYTLVFACQQKIKLVLIINFGLWRKCGWWSSQLKPLCYLNSSEIVLLIKEDGLVFLDLKADELKDVEVGVVSPDYKPNFTNEGNH
ncbi:hypothetical protein LWI28_024191 [Acer negundo]|uniref:F-box domain-containing protein n=1 Tax=Acer negundo TaxID=4023 RepID=A0AAD5JKH2_ACENE|nr:hypothetical protein LWI28_024191 [Acer negundo]